MKRIKLLFTTILAMFLINSLVFGQQDTTLTVTNSGNVGIGTDKPGQKLEVDKGNILVKGVNSFKSANDEAVVYFGDTNHYIKSVYSQGMRIGTYKAPDAIVLQQDTGNFGIGTASPSAKLHVNGNLQIGDDAKRISMFTYGTGEDIASTNTLHLNYDNNQAVSIGEGGASDLYISGKVGIGTTSPQGKLDVNGSIYQRGGLLHADYVFEPDYKLESIEDHAKFMWKNKHLKAIPKAKVDENGRQIVEVGAHRKGIVEELEKAHIYIDQLHNRIKTLEATLEKLAIRLDGNN